MTEALSEEALQAIADRDWWQEWATPFGWTVYGWTYRHTASFRDAAGMVFHIDGMTMKTMLDLVRERLVTKSEIWAGAVARQAHASMEGRCFDGKKKEVVKTPCKEGCRCEREIENLALHLTAASKPVIEGKM